jgi:O-antigen/teichoic acid export membrane protein
MSLMMQPDSFARLSETATVRKQLKVKSVRGAMAVASSGAIEISLRFLSITILARLLVPEYFGLIAMVTAFTGIVEGLRDLGLASATVQRQNITRAQVSNLFWVNAAAGFSFALLFSVLSPAIAAFYGDPRLVGITVALSTAFLWSGLSIQHEALMSRQLRQSELAIIRLAATFLSIAVAVVLAVTGQGYWALVWRYVVRAAMTTIGVWLRCPWLPGRPSRGVGTGGLLRFGRDLSFTNLLVALIMNIDLLLIGKFYGASAVGLYRQAQQLLVVPIEQLNMPIMSVAQPALSALQAESARYRRYYEKIVFFVTLATVPLGLFVAVYAKEITLLVLGSDWVGAAVFVRIFGMAAAVRPAVGTSAVVLISCGESARYLWIVVVHSAVLLIFLLFGIRWGPEGVAVAHVATTIVLMIPKLYVSFLRTPVTVGVFVRGARGSLIAGTAMAIGLLVAQDILPARGTLSSLVLGAGVAGILYLIGWLAQPGGTRQLMTLAGDLGSSLRRGGP